MLSYFELALIFVGLCFAVILSAIIYLRWNFKYWTYRNVIGPNPKILHGTFPLAAAGHCNVIEELHQFYLKYRNRKFIGVFASRNPRLFILDPNLAKDILTQHFKHFRDNESSQWTSKKVEKLRLGSPFVSIGDDWKEKRSELTPALTVNRLRAFYPHMRESAKKLVTFIDAKKDIPLDAKQLANRFTAEFVANFIWGIEAEAFAHATPSTIHELANSLIAQSLKCVRYYGKTAAWPWLRRFKPEPFFPAVCDQFFLKLARDTLQIRAEASPDRCDVINHLLQLRNKKRLSDIQIAGHTTTVLIDGFETGAMVTAHFLLLLARNKRVQEKLRAELMAAGSEVSYDELNDLPYLDQCVQETLRLFPPLPLLIKICTEAISFKDSNGTEVALQPQDVIYISSYSFHHDAEYYENPEEFWPERFAQELGGSRKFFDEGVFLPFGNGPRICLGMKLGLSEVKVAVAEVVRHFEIIKSSKTRCDNKVEPDSFLLGLNGGIELIFEKL